MAGERRVSGCDIQAPRLTAPQVRKFRRTIYRFYANHRRELPWRQTQDPYCILVSEVMLQQTQVERVVQKYLSFINRFPTFSSLAEASLRDVLCAWQGLGYNRRAASLKKIAGIVCSSTGRLPPDIDFLTCLPGIGYNTASAILVYAFNEPAVYIETNIRSVFLPFFSASCFHSSVSYSTG